MRGIKNSNTPLSCNRSCASFVRTQQGVVSSVWKGGVYSGNYLQKEREDLWTNSWNQFLFSPWASSNHQIVVKKKKLTACQTNTKWLYIWQKNAYYLKFQWLQVTNMSASSACISPIFSFYSFWLRDSQTLHLHRTHSSVIHVSFKYISSLREDRKQDYINFRCRI